MTQKKVVLYKQWAKGGGSELLETLVRGKPDGLRARKRGGDRVTSGAFELEEYGNTNQYQFVTRDKRGGKLN